MRTLRGRLTALSVLVVAAALTLTGAVVIGTTGRAQARALEQDLADRLVGLAVGGRDVGARPGASGPRPPRPDPGGTGPGATSSADRLAVIAEAAGQALGPGVFLVVRHPDGTLLATFGDVPDPLPPIPADLPGAGPPGPGPRLAQAERVTGGDGTTYLVRAARTPSRPALVLQIGADLDRAVSRQQQALRTRVLLVGSAATVLTGLVTHLVVGLATRPLRSLREATARVAATEDLTTRVSLDDAPGEVEAVADGLNTMLARLERSAAARESALQAARRFAADAGHEMRTPLAAMRATLEGLVRNPGAGEVLQAEALSEVAEEAARLSGLLESLQALARADAGLVDEVGPIDLAEVAREAVEQVRRRHPDVAVELVGTGPVMVLGSATWLRSIADNLVGNAAVHGVGADGRPPHVRVRVGAEEGGVLLVVDDEGPGIPPEERERVLQRFIRGADAAGRPGSGLGLSLAAQLAALHGGVLRLGSAPTGGLRAEVHLPPPDTTTPGRPAG